MMAMTGMGLRSVYTAPETTRNVTPREVLESEVKRRAEQLERDKARRAVIAEAWREYREWERGDE